MGNHFGLTNTFKVPSDASGEINGALVTTAKETYQRVEAGIATWAPMINLVAGTLVSGLSPAPKEQLTDIAPYLPLHDDGVGPDDLLITSGMVFIARV